MLPSGIWCFLAKGVPNVLAIQPIVLEWCSLRFLFTIFLNSCSEILLNLVLLVNFSFIITSFVDCYYMFKYLFYITLGNLRCRLIFLLRSMASLDSAILLFWWIWCCENCSLYLIKVGLGENKLALLRDGVSFDVDWMLLTILFVCLDSWLSKRLLVCTCCGDNISWFFSFAIYGLRMGSCRDWIDSILLAWSNYCCSMFCSVLYWTRTFSFRDYLASFLFGFMKSRLLRSREIVSWTGGDLFSL